MEHTIYSTEAAFASFSRAEVDQNVMEFHLLAEQPERNNLTLSLQLNADLWGH